MFTFQREGPLVLEKDSWVIKLTKEVITFSEEHISTLQREEKVLPATSFLKPASWKEEAKENLFPYFQGGEVSLLGIIFICPYTNIWLKNITDIGLVNNLI